MPEMDFNVSKREAEIQRGREAVQRHEQSRKMAQEANDEAMEQEEEQLRKMREDPASTVDMGEFEDQRRKHEEEQMRVFTENNDAVAESDPVLAAKIRGEIPEDADAENQGEALGGEFSGQNQEGLGQQTWAQSQPTEGVRDQGTRDPKASSGYTVLSREELEKRAETEGLPGLRRVAGPLGVKGRGKEELIEEILAAQEQKAKEGSPVDVARDGQEVQKLQK